MYSYGGLEGLSVLILELDTRCGVGGQFHASAALPPRESESLLIEKDAEWAPEILTLGRKENSLPSAENRTRITL